MLKKQKEGETWGRLLKLEKAEKFEVPEMGDPSDAQGGLMSMMKKMYDQGDDEMKRAIKKAAFESQQKKGGPGSGFDLPPLA